MNYRRILKLGENVTDARKRWRKEEAEIERIKRQKERQLENERKEKSAVIPPPIKYIPGNKKLSVLICSIKGREILLQGLMKILKGQITNDVEILVETDNKEMTTGAKRNILLERARGDYIAFVDDDDIVSDDYVSKILKAIETSPDCCGIEGEIDHIKRMRPGIRYRRRCKQKFIHSNRYTKWYEQNEIYYRCPNHLNPIKRILAGQIMFPEKNQAEDRDFSLRILQLLKTEVYIEGIIYYYRAVL